MTDGNSHKTQLPGLKNTQMQQLMHNPDCPYT